MKRSFASPSRVRQRGATLIEVLVSFLIVSFGVLAMMATQANALQFNKTNEYRSIATLLANDLGDRMKANLGDPAAAAAGGALNSSYNKMTSYKAISSMPAIGACPATCSPLEVANRDLAFWQRSLVMALPDPDAYVSYNAANRAVDVWIAWLDPSQNTTVAAGGTTPECPAAFVSISSTTKPRCMYFRISLPSRPPP